MPYKWEWEGAPEQQSDGLKHYRACRQVFREDPTDSILYSVGDIVFSCVDGDPMPWVAQIIGFVMGTWRFHRCYGSCLGISRAPLVVAELR
jgi:hypothetical protein